MKNPVNRLAGAAPRALDSLLGGGSQSTSKDHHEMKQKKERTCSFDLDLSGLHLDARSRSSIGASSSSVGLSGGSIAEEGSVVTFEDLSEFTNELNLDWKVETTTGLPAAAPSPNY